MKQRDEKKETRKLPMSRRGKRLMVIYAALVLMMTAGATTVFAADDPLTVINNLSEFIFGLIRAIGMILLGFGIVQIGLSLKSHDPWISDTGRRRDHHVCKRNPDIDRGIRNIQ